MSAEFDIQEELKKLPGKPGVYIMHGKDDGILYVGKAVSLKNRVRQYFQSSRGKSPKIVKMVSQIDHFEYIVTDSELEALVLESNLIKEHRPKYNTMLKDDKSYPYIRVTCGEDYPRIQLCRSMKKDSSRYYGPYPTAGAVRDTIELLRKLCRIRSCDRKLPEQLGKDRPCLYYHIGQCDAPCEGRISKEEYRKNVDRAVSFLNGDTKSEIERLREKMMKASEAMEFEEAALYRDLIDSICIIGEKQKITANDGDDRDIIAVATDSREEGGAEDPAARTVKEPAAADDQAGKESAAADDQAVKVPAAADDQAGKEPAAADDQAEGAAEQAPKHVDAVVQVFFVRGGKLIGREHFFLTVEDEKDTAQILKSFIMQYYAGTPFVPKELMLEADVEDRELLEEYLTKKRGSKVQIRIPQRGMKEKLTQMAHANAVNTLTRDRERLVREELRTIGAVKEIAGLLGLRTADRMEAYDISNISGFESVGSMIVYDRGKPKRTDYRKFKIRTVEGPNDYASMEEVLTRRFRRAIEGSPGFTALPDVVLMDGGKGQVHVAERVLSDLHLDIPVAGMVKDDFHRTRGIWYRGEELPIDTASEGFKLITRIQDEAHRFAIEYHRLLRSKGQVHSLLDDIPGIGETRRKALIRSFGSLEAIRDASIEELANAPSMNRPAALRVYSFFHGNTEPEMVNLN